MLRHFSPPPGYAASIQLFRWCNCLHTPKSFRTAVRLLHQTLVGVVCGEESKKLVSKTERNKLCSTNAYCNKLSGYEAECVCVCSDVCSRVFALVERSCCVCTWDECVRMRACVCACKFWWKEASTARATGCFFILLLLSFVSRLVTMRGGERAAVPMQHHSSHMSNS